MGAGVIKPVDSKVKAITNWPLPQTKRQIRSFLGPAGYYPKIVNNFGTITAPLSELCNKTSILVK